jgi:heme O synthase-like polyprenyltransferase
MRNNGLDEMQKDRRNRVGNQMFMLMFFALLIDSDLYGAGVRWLDYPANVMVIISTCISIYLVRLIALSAYHPPKTQDRTHVTLIVSIIVSIALAVVLSITQIAEKNNDNSAIILFVVSAVGLLGILIAAVIKKINSSKNDKDE